MEGDDLEFIERVDDLTGNGGAATLLSEVEAKRVDELYKGTWRLMPDLTDADYDTLFAVMKDDLPRILAGDLPEDPLAQLEGAGVLTITVTDTEVVVSSAKPPQTTAPMLGPQ